MKLYLLYICLILKRVVSEQLGEAGINLEYQGCYEDDADRHIKSLRLDEYPVTPTRCATDCYNLGYVYSGTEAGHECFCGTPEEFAHPDYPKMPDEECNFPCKGDGTLHCGGPWLNSVYKAVEEAGELKVAYEGCYQDSEYRHLKSHQVHAHYDYQTTNTKCAADCYALGYVYSGTQAGDHCFCGTQAEFKNQEYQKQPDDQCTTPCKGDNSIHMCGGGWRNAIYKATVTSDDLNEDMNTVYEGCYEDNSDRHIKIETPFLEELTPTACAAKCYDLGYAYSGTQAGHECFCGNEDEFNNPDYARRPDEECNTPCSGDINLQCGGPWRNAIYKTTGTMTLTTNKIEISKLTTTLEEDYTTSNAITQTPTDEGGNQPATTTGAMTTNKITTKRTTTQQQQHHTASSVITQTPIDEGDIDNQPATTTGAQLTVTDETPIIDEDETEDNEINVKYEGCYEDNVDRHLKSEELSLSDLTPTKCATECHKLGHTYSGTQAGHDCFCGTQDEFETAGYAMKPDWDCDFPCSGDNSLQCGGAWRNSVYKICDESSNESPGSSSGDDAGKIQKGEIPQKKGSSKSAPIAWSIYFMLLLQKILENWASF